MYRLFLRFVSIFALLGLSAVAFADSTYFFPHRPNEYFANPEAACNAAIADAQALSTDLSVLSATVYSGSSACLFNVRRNSDDKLFYDQGLKCRAEGGCPLSRKGCVAGETDTYTWPLGRLDTSAEFNIAPGTQISPPANSCVDGCKAQHLAGGTPDCFNSSQEQGSITYCNYNAKLNGESCTTSENQPPEVPQPTDPGDGGTDPGDGGTDPGDGGTDPGDGGTDPGGGGTPGDGGTNPGDGGTNPGNGGTNPGNGGTNPGNGGTNPGGGDSDGNSASGIECSQPLACSGDAIQCAILDTQKRARCDAIGAWDFPSQKDAIDDFIKGQGDKAELDEGDGEVDLSGLFSGPTDPRFLPAACPPAKTFTLQTQGGRTFEFSYEPLCQFAIDLGYLIVIAASLFYAIYVGRASGGE